MKLTIKHTQPVWEETTFEVNAEGITDPDVAAEWALDNLDELMLKAVDEGTAFIEVGDSIFSMDSNTEIRNEEGEVIFGQVNEGIE